MKQQAKILFFITDAMPTAKELAAADELSAHVVFRNANYIPAEGSLEHCDGVAGTVPKRYAEAFPKAKEAIAAHKKANEAKRGAMGETLAPELPPQTGTPAAASVPVGSATPVAAPAQPQADSAAPAPAAAPAGTAAAPKPWGQAAATPVAAPSAQVKK